MSVSLDVFLPFVSPRALGAPYPALIQAIRESIIQYCFATRAWKYTFPEVTVAANAKSIAVPVDSNSSSVVIEELYWDGYLITPVSQDRLTDYNTWTTKTGTPQNYFQLDPDNVSFYPYPSASGKLTGRVVLRPTESATTVPDFIFNEYARDIADGALSYLLSVPGKSYTNFDLAVMHGNKFSESIAASKFVVAKGWTRAPIRTRPKFM